MIRLVQTSLLPALALTLMMLAPFPGHGEPATIMGTARVVDGDTIDVGVVRIRLHGIDAPEAGLTCGRSSGGTWACGTAATNRLAELIEGRRVECEALDRDPYTTRH